ncbi:hypothetical protein Q0M94_28280 (plasmid) [Deinococcus radiomollis]|uniref:hypothetical protein n=1 Tax=Deinococcus radiomollis TaxID=468916 RepID=UPI003891C700
MINEPALEAALNAILAERADAAKLWLRDDALNRPGTGLLHSYSPNQSSSQTEYPAEQTGALRSSIDARQVGPLTFAIGSFEDLDAEGFRHAEELESRPTGMGGRHFLERALAEGELAHVLLTGRP